MEDLPLRIAAMSSRFKDQHLVAEMATRWPDKVGALSSLSSPQAIPTQLLSESWVINQYHVSVSILGLLIEYRCNTLRQRNWIIMQHFSSLEFLWRMRCGTLILQSYSNPCLIPNRFPMRLLPCATTSRGFPMHY